MAKARPLAEYGVDEGELLRRAFAAWFKGGGEHTDQPSKASEVEAHDGRWYVVLRGGRGPADEPMAVYRLKNDGMLRRLRRWPADIKA